MRLGPTTAIAALAAPLLATACGAGAPPRAASSWQQTMSAVGAEFAQLRAVLEARPQGDLDAAAAAARRTAELLRDGYGPREPRDQAGFAAKARACESWLLEIALEADQGHGELARELLGNAARCAGCHEHCRKRS